eukprot:6197843-Pleurochrysis_carterae.AAC.2
MSNSLASTLARRDSASSSSTKSDGGSVLSAPEAAGVAALEVAEAVATAAAAAMAATAAVALVAPIPSPCAAVQGSNINNATAGVIVAPGSGACRGKGWAGHEEQCGRSAQARYLLR